MARKFNRGFRPNRKIKAEHRINEFIRVPEIRLVGDNFESINKAAGQTMETGIFPTRKIAAIARDMGLDLVEISPKAKPPVCRIIDYGKFLYERKKRAKEQQAKQVKVVVKEIRFGPNTDDHDFEFKLKHARKFLGEGAKVKAYVHFKGRSIVFKDRGKDLLRKFIDALKEEGSPEYGMRLEDRRMHCTLAPKKAKVAAPKKSKHKGPKDEKKAPKVNKESATKEDK